MNEDDFNDLDELMAQDPLELSAQNLDRIIAYQRKQRAQREAGVKTRKHRGEARPTISIEEMVAKLPQAPKTSSGIRRRF